MNSPPPCMKSIYYFFSPEFFPSQGWKNRSAPPPPRNHVVEYGGGVTTNMCFLPSPLTPPPSHPPDITPPDITPCVYMYIREMTSDPIETHTRHVYPMTPPRRPSPPGWEEPGRSSLFDGNDANGFTELIMSGTIHQGLEGFLSL